MLQKYNVSFIANLLKGQCQSIKGVVTYKIFLFFILFFIFVFFFFFFFFLIQIFLEYFNTLLPTNKKLASE